MDAAGLVRIGQRLIAGVHDGQVLLDSLEEVVHDVLRPLLEDLEGSAPVDVGETRWPLAARSADPLEPPVLGTGSTHLSGAGKNLAGDEKDD